MQQKLSVIIPAYNEERTIYQLLQKVKEVVLSDDIDKEIIIVNDCSKDNTDAEVKRFIEDNSNIQTQYFIQEKNSGKGAALKQGIKIATGNWIIIQDADLEYDPQDYKPLLNWMIENDSKVVYGSRFLNKENKHSYQRFYFGGRLLSILTNILYFQNLTDEPTCYKMFDAEFLKSIPLNCTGFEFCPEVTAKVCKKGIKIKELPIKYYPRSISEGKKINWKDGVIGIWTLFKYRFTN